MMILEFLHSKYLQNQRKWWRGLQDRERKLILIGMSVVIVLFVVQTATWMQDLFEDLHDERQQLKSDLIWIDGMNQRLTKINNQGGARLTSVQIRDHLQEALKKHAIGANVKLDSYTDGTEIVRLDWKGTTFARLLSAISEVELKGSSVSLLEMSRDGQQSKVTIELAD